MQPNPRALITASFALARSGLMRPYRPDHLMRIGSALPRYGAGPGFGPLAGATFCPDKPGIIDDDGMLTFGQLEERCAAVAGGLAAIAPPGDSIALLGRNSAGFYQTVVAASRCGLDVLYLNTGFSADQIAEALTRRAVRAVVHDAELAEKVPRDVLSIPMTGKEPISIERMAAGQQQQPGTAPRRSRHIMLTSGTTGQPKPVSRSTGDIRSVISLVSGLPNRARETCLIAAPMFHGWGWLNMLLTMLFSSTIVVARRFDPQRTLEITERERCQALVAVPTMLRRIMGLEPDIRRQYDTSSLRAVTVSGSALPPALADDFMAEFGDILYSLYGSTEAGYAAVASPADLRAEPGTAGRPLPLVDVRIRDDNGAPCPRGRPGVVWVSSHESLGDLLDEVSGEAKVGAVCTGDIGWLDQAGRLFIAGRTDDLIITGAENVYPAEVENVLERHPSVLEAAVVGSPDEVRGQILLAHLVLREGAGVTPRALRSWCRNRLAPFQVPERFIIHDGLPHNAAGKVVKRELQDPG